MKRMLLTAMLMTIVFMCFAQTPARPNWVTFERTGATTGIIRWSSEPSVNVDYYYLGCHPTTTQYFAPAYCDPNWNVPGGPVGNMTLEAPGVFYRNVVGLDAAFDYHAYVAAVTYSDWSWSALSSWDSPPPPAPYDCPESETVAIYPDVNLTMLLGNANYAAGQPPTPPINPSFNAAHIQFFTLVGAGPWTMQFETTLQWIWVVGYGIYEGPMASIPIPASKDLDIEVQFGNGGNPTLPVALSSFTATITAETFVSLKWITQSESGLQGYRVFRGSTGSYNSSTMITPTLIPATNTSSMAAYSYDDHEVEPGNTYWYWLESVENNSQSNIHGPVMVTVTQEVPPAQVLQNSISDAWPNPFRKGSFASFEVSVKTDEAAVINIYNIRGAVVRKFSLPSGIHQIQWNGKDAHGRDCGSGIYFARLNTPSMSQTKKLLMVK